MNNTTIDNSSFSLKQAFESREKLKQYNIFYFRWQLCRFLGALSASLALIPATISYEHSYNPSRTLDHCQIIYENTFFYRSITLTLSFTGIFLELLYKHFYFQWINWFPLTLEELPSPNSISFLEVVSMVRKRKKIEYLTTKYTWVIILLYLLFPYPGISQEIRIPQQMLYKHIEVCYYVEEFLYFTMFFRLFYLMLTVCAYGRFQEPIARRICEVHRVENSAVFSFKCYASTHPLVILAFLLVIPGIIVFGIGIRIFERPLGLQDLDSIENSMWLVVVTMTTVGYGDRVPYTVCSRGVVLLAIFWGGINLSLTFVTLGSFLKLEMKENEAYRAILANRESGNIISNCAADSFHVKNKIRGIRLFWYRIQNFFWKDERIASAETLNYRVTEKIIKSFKASNQIVDQIDKKLLKLSHYLKRRKIGSYSSYGSSFSLKVK